MATNSERPHANGPPPDAASRLETRSAPDANAPVVLRIEDLTVEYLTDRGWMQAVRGVSMEVRAGEVVGLIGESGSGKSTLSFALLRMLPRSARISSGAIWFLTAEGKMVDLTKVDSRQFKRLRWSEFSMVFQAAQNSLNPVLKVSDTFFETARAHGMRGKGDIRNRSLELLGMVQLDADRVFSAYPHELSGGMRQRVSIALALLLEPQLIIFDEPTTALDIITQRVIIDVIRSLRAKLDFTMLFISHDLSLAAELADHVATMYAGEVVEYAPVREAFYNPKHPYTVGLLNAVPPIVGTEFTPLTAIRGATPNLLSIPSGCAFHPRCPYATDVCHERHPNLETVAPLHQAACFHHDKVTRDQEIWETLEPIDTATAAV